MAKMDSTIKVVKEFNPERFRVIFRAVFALISFLVGMIFITFAVFSKTAAESEFTGPVIGFICGTLITLILTYYYGSADGSVPESKPPIVPKPTIPDKKEGGEEGTMTDAG